MKVGITSGCYDLLHPTHVQYLEKCRRLCDYLIVLVDSDYLVNQRKSRSPVIYEYDRKYMLESLKCVDKVIIFNSLEEYTEIINSILRKDLEDEHIIFKHSETIDKNALITFSGVATVIVEDVIRFTSTTQIINHLKTLQSE